MWFWEACSEFILGRIVVFFLQSLVSLDAQLRNMLDSLCVRLGGRLGTWLAMLALRWSCGHLLGHAGACGVMRHKRCHSAASCRISEFELQQQRSPRHCFFFSWSGRKCVVPLARPAMWEVVVSIWVPMGDTKPPSGSACARIGL